MKRFLTALVFSYAALCYAAAPTSLTKAANQFSLTLFKSLQASHGNQVVSPYSVFNVFAMIYPGANGQTKQQIKTLFGFPTSAKTLSTELVATNKQLLTNLNQQGNTFNVANAVWLQSGFAVNKSYQAALMAQQAQLQRVNFASNEQAAKTINAWVSQMTHQSIKTLVTADQLSAQTRLALLNAVYFNANWAKPFSKAKTNPNGTFYPTAQTKIKAAMMNQSAMFPYYANQQFQLIGLPYSSPHVSMLILLPKSGVSLAALISKLTVSQLDQAITKLKPRFLSLSLPRFGFSLSLPLSDTLQSLGLTSAFGQTANFSALSKTPLFISTVLQKARIDVNEKGTTAAAATAAIMNRMAIVMRPALSFNADRPFLFMIRDNQTGLIVFLGILANPSN